MKNPQKSDNIPHIYKFIFSAFILILISLTPASAQERYASHLFDEINVETVNYAEKDGENLDMDIYSSPYDTTKNRVTIIFAHGGGFYAGTRNHPKIQEFCKRLAGYGYVVASVSYRLTRAGKSGAFGCNCPTQEKENAVYAAMEDFQDATAFFIQNWEQYGIDPYRIILAGSSAGAEAALSTAYQPSNCYGLEGGPVAYAGVISMSGAVADTTMIYDDSAVPSLFFHGTNDKLVPYATAPHHYCKKSAKGYWILNGSYTIAQKLDRLGTSYWLQTYCGAGHEVNTTPMTDQFDEIIEFCHDFVIEKKKEQRRTYVKSETVSEEKSVYDFCEN